MLYNLAHMNMFCNPKSIYLYLFYEYLRVDRAFLIPEYAYNTNPNYVIFGLLFIQDNRCNFECNLLSETLINEYKVISLFISILIPALTE